MIQKRDSLKGQMLLGCDCVAHCFRTTMGTQPSSLLVSLQNHFWQIDNFILLQPLNKNYRKLLLYLIRVRNASFRDGF